MSRLLDAITAKYTGRNVTLPVELDITSRLPEPCFDITREQEISVTLRMIVSVKKDEDFRFMIEQFRRILRELLYGDIKERVNRLERAVYERKYDQAQMEIRDIVKEVFG